MFAAGLVTRVVSLVGTLLVVRYVTPGDYGEAITAAILIGTASTFSSLGIGQFVIVKGGGRRDLAFHATVFQLVLGAVALGVVLLMASPFAAWTRAPGLGRYLPPMALSMLLDRLWLVPERTLMRDMRFRTVALARSAGELAYTGVSLATAMLGWGGMAIAAGNVARSGARALVTVPAVDRRDWLEPTPLRRDASLAVFRFGLPLAVASIAAYGAGKWDNLLVAGFFGPAVMAAYNIAYNLAGVASAIVAEHVIDILVPSFARTERGRRPDALVRGAALVALISAPLCLGLAAVSPTAVATLFDPKWAAVAPLLAALSVAATQAPMVGLVQAYLQAADRSRLAMIVQLTLVVAIIGSVATVGRLGPLWTAGAVGIGSFVCVLVGARLVRAVDGVPVHRLLSTQLGPLLACLPMVGAVLGVRWLLARAGLHVPYLNLAVEIAAGAAAYCAAVFVVARGVTRDLIGLVQRAFSRAAPSLEA